MPGLDGLRGVLVLGILAYHLGFAPAMFATVDGFFALSGFLITGLLLDRTPSNVTELTTWWGWRIRRLVPAVSVLVLTVVVVFASTSGIARDGFATMTWWANWNQIFNGTSYWAPQPSPLRHAWTLSIEEQSAAAALESARATLEAASTEPPTTESPATESPTPAPLDTAAPDTTAAPRHRSA